MIHDPHTKEVRFDIYCKTCKYSNTSQFNDPCNGCLSQPYNIDSRKPVNWKEKED